MTYSFAQGVDMFNDGAHLYIHAWQEGSNLVPADYELDATSMSVEISKSYDHYMIVRTPAESFADIVWSGEGANAWNQSDDLEIKEGDYKLSYDQGKIVVTEVGHQLDGFAIVGLKSLADGVNENSEWVYENGIFGTRSGEGDYIEQVEFEFDAVVNDEFKFRKGDEWVGFDSILGGAGIVNRVGEDNIQISKNGLIRRFAGIQFIP